MSNNNMATLHSLCLAFRLVAASSGPFEQDTWTANFTEICVKHLSVNCYKNGDGGKVSGYIWQVYRWESPTGKCQ